MKKTETLSWLCETGGRHKLIIAMLMLIQTVISGITVFYAIILRDMIDSAVSRNRQDFLGSFMLFVCLIVLTVLLRMLFRYLDEHTRSNLENTLKERLMNSLLTKDYAQITAVHSEEWMNRMTSDTAVCANGITEILPGIAGMAVRIAGALIMIFILQPKLACIMIPCGVLLALVTVLFRRRLKLFHKRVQEKDGAFRVYAQERISSMLVLRTFGVEDVTLKAANEKMAEHKQARIRKSLISGLCNAGFSVAMNGMYLMGIGYCALGILNGSVTYGTLTAIMQLTGQLQAPLAGIGGYVPKYYAMLASAERLIKAEEYKESGCESCRTSEQARDLYTKEFSRIVLDNITFAYQSQKAEDFVLRNVNQTLEKGDYISFTGLSGCGKSTLLYLLMGIYEPVRGSVYIETADGRKLPIKEWKRLFAYVPQGNYLMSGTIREVITFGRQEKDSAQRIEKALELACAEFVHELPDGIDTFLGEKGMGLSEGQMQRIAVARALYADAPILILDEATSALDELTERRLLEKLKQLTDKMVLIVTHRTAALGICNKQIKLTDENK